jgi:putative flippase GtrA
MAIESKNIKRFLKFGFVGGLGFLIDFTVVLVFAWLFKRKVVPPLNELDFSSLATFFEFILNVFRKNLFNFIVPVIGYFLAVINNFLWSHFWVWKDRERRFFFNFLKYFVSTLFAFVVRFVFFQGMLYLFKITKEEDLLYYMMIYAAAIGIGMLINFILIEFKVFKKIDPV